MAAESQVRLYGELQDRERIIEDARAVTEAGAFCLILESMPLELAQTIIAPIRLRVGQDASCNNLYQATRPTVLGIPESFGDLFGDQKLAGFQWAACAS